MKEKTDEANKEKVEKEKEKENTCANCKHTSKTFHKFCEMCGGKLTRTNEEEKDSNLLDVSKTYSYIISE